MLKLKVETPERDITLQMEHSLISMSKWESVFCVPFFLKPIDDFNENERNTYFQCMTITQNIDFSLYSSFSKEIIQEIVDYIKSPMTASLYNEKQVWNELHTRGPGKSIVTTEYLYYLMGRLHIPPEYEKWNFNRLYALIKITEETNRPKERLSQSQIASRNWALNEARRKRLNTKG